MPIPRAAWLSAIAVLLQPGPLPAHHVPLLAPGSLVAVEVQVEGRAAPLYPAPDGSGRLYLEAHEGAPYAILLRNRTTQRLGVAISVDGLNVISGEHSHLPQRRGDAGRMYVLEPGQVSEVRGWRTSLRDVQRFVFVDEAASYAARTGQANSRMGWIELAVYRERGPRWSQVAPWSPPPDTEPTQTDRSGQQPDAARDQAEAGRRAPAAPRQKEPDVGLEKRSSYPGTGWGSRADDPARLVAFDPEPQPAERVTLRYEYREALQALGIEVGGPMHRGRLWQRDRGEAGFARPPHW